ncbi:F0F1 ATP synthase subunit A [Gulosibacter molinativorax]|uniref:ATP synthase subunit a n=1 Tax=Gulosibacter molinativorax TaxID=256821 RepID=A0ABT7C3R0_9MICO|nr:F0F1 ATP synthase subunit A [Gulosibacter molinativorax]MDJ1369876.1 ATP synthase F0 subunit A [Gulosibacter molinativorax]QUY61841.1 ATP synthase subunit a [Gulosibacter molinativorax]
MTGIAVTAGGEFHAPNVDEEFFPPALLFDGTPFEINRIILVRLIAVAVLMLIFWLALRKPKVVPGKLQSLVEMGVGFVRDGIVYDMLGERIGKKYLPYILVLFFGVLFMNLTGITPFLNISGNAIIGMPIVLALTTYVVFIYAGIREVGGWKFLKNALFPSGVPWVMYILLTPIEFVNTFVVRPVSLALRLFLNLMVGHLLLVLAFSATWFFFGLLNVWSAMGIITLAGGFFMTLIELLVAILQAYVFALLTTSYIQLSVSEEH